MLPKRILTVGLPSDYPQPAFHDACAEQVDFAISLLPDHRAAVTKDRQGRVPRPASIPEIMSCTLVRPDQAQALLGTEPDSTHSDDQPKSRFVVDDRITPGPDSILPAGIGSVGTVKAKEFCPTCGEWHYLVQFEGGAKAIMLESRMLPTPQPSSRDEDDRPDYRPTEAQERFHGAWRGTPPAPGTRRELIFDVLTGSSVHLTNGSGGHITNASALKLADDVESALLEATIAEECEELPDGAHQAAAEALSTDEGDFNPILEVERAVQHLNNVLVHDSEDKPEAPAPGEVVEVEQPRNRFYKLLG